MSNTLLCPAHILLPKREEIDRGLWATIACDQFTSDPSYWQEAEALVGDAPSTLRLMLPEVYLKETDIRLPAIHAAMRTALTEHLISHPDAMVAVERTQSDGRVRRGLVAAVDLEEYDYHRGATSLIRATEGTVLERIPPRVAVRRGAAIELPHVMLLIDDPDRTVLEPLFDGAAQDTRTVAYDCDLMLGGGHIRGSYLTAAQMANVNTALAALITPQALAARYGDSTLSPLLFAVGDGNHSLASAKAAWEEIKATLPPAAQQDHPARYALCELVNLHDEALSFEPIYRVLFHVEPTQVLAAWQHYIGTLQGTAAPQTVRVIGAGAPLDVVIPAPVRQLPVGTLQDFLDAYLKEHPEAEVDYIHDEDATLALAAAPDAIGFLFDGMAKDQLFRTVIYDGALPRKTFSMGHARDKRYYMECRSIRNEP